MSNYTDSAEYRASEIIDQYKEQKTTIIEPIEESVYKLVTNLTIRVQELEAELKMWEDDTKEISDLMYTVGGPLNDNLLGYSKKQLAIFHRIDELC